VAQAANLQKQGCTIALSGISIPFGERAGERRYRLFSQYLNELPIPTIPGTERKAIARRCREAAPLARERYELSERFLHRLTTSFGAESKGQPTLKLRSWPGLTFLQLGVELVKSFQLHASPWQKPQLADQWGPYFAEQTIRFASLSTQLSDAEAEINERVYRLFGLGVSEIKQIEEEVSS
jgi:hypothetical protein